MTWFNSVRGVLVGTSLWRAIFTLFITALVGFESWSLGSCGLSFSLMAFTSSMMLQRSSSTVNCSSSGSGSTGGGGGGPGDGGVGGDGGGPGGGGGVSEGPGDGERSNGCGGVSGDVENKVNIGQG